MTQRIGYFQIMVGMPGYLPNAHEFRAWESRREMVQDIESLLDDYGFSQRARRRVNMVRAWRAIQEGRQIVHFTLPGGMGQPCIMEFRQIDAEEFKEGIESC